jgi:hypothetical protein
VNWGSGGFSGWYLRHGFAHFDLFSMVSFWFQDHIIIIIITWNINHVCTDVNTDIYINMHLVAQVIIQSLSVCVCVRESHH